MVLITLKAQGRESGKNRALGAGQRMPERFGFLLLSYLPLVASSPGGPAEDQIACSSETAEPDFCPTASTPTNPVRSLPDQLPRFVLSAPRWGTVGDHARLPGSQLALLGQNGT